MPDSAKLQKQQQLDQQRREQRDRKTARSSPLNEAVRIVSLPLGASAGGAADMFELLEEYLQDIQTTREAEGDRCWVPPGKIARVAGYKIPGMVYVGEQLSAVSHPRAIEPSLIRPKLKIDRKHPDSQGQEIAYGYNSRSYTQMQPNSRAAYLEWLEDGRRDPKAFNGYVWLFFYGLERRVFHELLKGDWQADADKRQELEQIIDEVEQLKQVYGSAYSFHGAFNFKADEFLSICRTLQSPDRLVEIDPMTAKPLELQMGLGQKVKQRQPIPADWALAWYSRLSSYNLPTAAVRCPDEFRALFRLRYADRFGEGIKLKAGKTLLSTIYQPASQSFWGRTIPVNIGDLPDVSRFSAKLKQIGEVVQQCRLELESFSRYLARNPDGRDTPSAIALLPADLIDTHGGKTIKKLQKWLNQLFPQRTTQVVVISGKEVMKHWSGNHLEKLTKSEATGLAQFLEKLGFGMEPDSRISSSLPSLKSHVALFRTTSSREALSPDANPTGLSEEFFTATLIAQMSLAVASGDQMPNPQEQAYLESHIQSVAELEKTERSRFEAHIYWLLQDKPTLKSLKTRIERLAPAQRAEIASFLVHVAAADGQITAAETKLLEKAYTLLDRDPQLLYSDIHDRSTTRPRSVQEPVTVRTATSTEGHKIPPPPKRKKNDLTLDMELVQSKLTESQEVSSLLAEIFVEEPEKSDAKPAAKPPKSGRKSGRAKRPVAETTTRLIAGLDAAHSELLLAIAQKPEWQRAELETIATRLSLMLDGALEVINDAAFDRCDEAVIEGEDPLEVNPAVAQELIK